MSRSYEYNKSYPVADEQEVTIKIEQVSDGSISSSNIEVYGIGSFPISDSGTATIGLGKNLRNITVVIETEVSNHVQQETDIKVNYYVNGKILVEHSKPKTEAEEQTIIIYLKLPEA